MVKLAQSMVSWRDFFCMCLISELNHFGDGDFYPLNLLSMKPRPIAFKGRAERRIYSKIIFYHSQSNFTKGKSFSVKTPL